MTTKLYRVPDLVGTFQRALSAGCQIDSQIAQLPWGETLFYARDPFGNLICFVDEKTVFNGQ